MEDRTRMSKGWTGKSLLAEIAQLNRAWARLGEAHIQMRSDEDLTKLRLTLTPKSGDFASARVEFELDWARHPIVEAKCLHRIFHCNISPSGSVCFSMLDGDDGWSKHYSLDAYVNGLRWLLDNPNGSSAMNAECAVRDAAQRRRQVQLAIRGLLPKVCAAHCVDTAAPLGVTSAEALRWLAATGKWWAETRLPAHCTLQGADDALHLLLRLRVDFRSALDSEHYMSPRTYCDAATGDAVLVLSHRALDAEQCERRLGRLLAAADALECCLLPAQPVHVYVDRAAPADTPLFAKWAAGFQSGLELRDSRRSSPRRQRSLADLLQLLYAAQANVRSFQLF